MADKLNIIEKLEVAKGCGLETRILITAEEADAFITLFKYLDKDAIAAMKANRKAKDQRIDSLSRRIILALSFWCAAWASYVPFYAMLTAWGM